MVSSRLEECPRRISDSVHELSVISGRSFFCQTRKKINPKASPTRRIARSANLRTVRNDFIDGRCAFGRVR